MLGKRSFVRDATVYRKNGTIVEYDRLPSTNARRYFISDILTVLINQKNPIDKHLCSPLCNNPVVIFIGYPLKSDLIQACPDELHQIIADMEHLLDIFVHDSDGRARIRTVALKILPCVRNTVILNAAIYL